MKALFNLMIVLAVLSIGCSPSNQRNETASDTASVLDTTRSNSQLDTSAVQNIEANDSIESTPASKYQESNEKQTPRTNLGKDTTGKRLHDNPK